MPNTVNHAEGCPACSCKRAIELKGRLYRCAKCNGIYGTCYLGESYEFVLPFMATQEVPAEKLQYFDFTTLGSKGVSRRHGWFDPATKLIHQIG
jgi:hypothetical protein